MMFAAAVMHPVIGSLLVRAVEKARKARAEIVKKVDTSAIPSARQRPCTPGRRVSVSR